MTLSSWFSFCLASFLLAWAPGPDNLFVCSQSALYGVRSGLAVVAGLCTGLLVQTLAAALGLAAVVAASPVLFWGIRIAGAAYLLYLAYMAWTHPLAGRREGERLTAPQLWRRGVVMNLSNPKVQIFFLAFFPQFATRGAGPWQTAVEMTVLGATFLVMTVAVFGLIAVLAGSLAEKMNSPRVQGFMSRGCAVLFTALAVLALRP